ncbi:MAG: thioredoxin-disulfide reductase [Candidatus Verstraetearchaeota archaeon]|nr:thioredoxin-disulfide reductase [Candidatus Verstraetearchaeota archaeon]
MNNKIYDIIIIGGGPAGISAAIYSKRKKLDTLIITMDIGGGLLVSGKIENYPGFIGKNSYELVEILGKQLKALDVEIKYGEVKKVEKEGEIFKVIANEGEYLAKAIIACSGSIPRKLNVPGEDKLIGRGVSYCAICDAPFSKNKIAAIIGGGNSAFQALESVSKYAKKVYLIHRSDKFRADPILINIAKSLNNVEFILNSIVTKINGENKVESITIKNIITNEEYDLNVDMIFIEIGRESKIDYIKHLVKLDEKGQIIVDKYQKTSCEGIFAAGDVTDRPYKQAIVAAGDGAIAALSAYDYLIRKGISPLK